jgi:hypothetical protein
VTTDPVQIIRSKFDNLAVPVQVPKLRCGFFTAELTSEGIKVSNLANQPDLPWAVFRAAVEVLERSGGRARRGNAMGPRLGEPALRLDSVEGHIAYAVYGKLPGDSVFRRITPVACILIWAGICRHEPGRLVLHDVQ